MIKIDIRKAIKDDLPCILALYSQSDIDNGNTLDLSSAEQIFKRMQKYPDYNVYIAMIGDEVIGTFALLIMDNLAHLGVKSGVVEDVVVSSKLRNQGIGKQMMNFAMEECRKTNCYKLTLSGNLKREPAHKFYESLGFQKHGYSFLINIENRK